jgi:thiol-disulfide isomerase/thioredoxin
LIAAAIFSVAICLPSVDRGQNINTDERVLQKIVDKLASVKTLKYRYKREMNYPSEGYLSETSADSFLDLKPSDSPTGFRFQFSSDDLLAIYNGSERFIADKKKKTVRVDNDPPLKSFQGFGFFYYSPLSLKNALPQIFADKTVAKKVTLDKINGVDDYVVEFVLDKQSIDPLGDVYTMKRDGKSTYKMTFDKATLLPIEVYAGNDLNKDFVRTNFLDIKENAPEPAPLTWYYSTYAKDYQLETPKQLVLLKNGQTAPEFKLNAYTSGEPVSLDQYKGKLVVVEFWIANCGFCIAAVPKINALAREFREKGVEFVAINAHDATKTIDIFKNNNKPEYRILTGGEATAETYGTDAFPTFVLIGKDGKVVYSRTGLDDKELESAIANNL